MQTDLLPEDVLLDEAPEVLIEYLEPYIKVKYIAGEVDSKWSRLILFAYSSLDLS